MPILCIYYVYSMCIGRSHFRSRFALCSEICVQNSCAQPAAMSAHRLEDAEKKAWTAKKAWRAMSPEEKTQFGIDTGEERKANKY